MKNIRILLSNDDGVHAPGILILYNALKQIGDVQVIAPDRDCSGFSKALTVKNPIRTKVLDNGFISVEGTPTDCVHLALTTLMPDPPDIVVAGINHGANLGEDVSYSGTVAAAVEGSMFGYPSMAISVANFHPNHLQTAAIVAKKLVLAILNNVLPSKKGVMLNVNVPDISLNELRGVEITRLGSRTKAEHTIAAKDPVGRPIYWIGPPGAEEDASFGTDFYAINTNKVSITPIQIDLTNYTLFDSINDWIKKINLAD